MDSHESACPRGGSPPCEFRRVHWVARALRLLALLALGAPWAAFSGTKTWVGGNGSGPNIDNWTITANWNPSGAPTSSDEVVFDGTSSRACVLNTNPTVINWTMSSGYTQTLDINTRLITITGNADFRTGGAISFTAANAKIIFTGSAAQTFIPKASTTMPTIEQNGTGGTTVTTNALTTGTLTLVNLASNGAFNLGTGLTHTVTTTLTLNTNGSLNFGSSTLNFEGTTADFSSLTTLTPGSGTLAFTHASNTQTFTPKSATTHPHITHTGAGTLQLATNTLQCLSFSNSAGVLNFNNQDITTVSAGNFTVTNGTTTTFTNLAGRTITVDGNASLAGQNGNLLNLNPVSAWTLTATASSAVSADYATIANGTVNPSSINGTTTNSTDGGGNTRWSFTLPKTWDGGGGDYNWNTAANWSGDAVPGSNHEVTFDGTSTKKCILNVDATVYSITFTSAYTSTDGNTGNFDFTTKTLTLPGTNANFTMGSGATVTPGTGMLAFSATAGTQTFTPRSGSTFPAVSKSGGGTVVVATTGLAAGDFSISGGTWDWGASTLTHSVASITASAGTMTFGSNTVNVTSGNANLNGLQTLNGDAGTLGFTAGSGTQIFTPKNGVSHPGVSHGGAGTLQLATYDLSASSFANSAGSLDFNGWNITSSGVFNVTNGTTSTMVNLGGRTITVGTNASLAGQNGNLLNLNPGSAWTLTAQSGSTVTASYATIANGTVNPSDITGSASNSTNGGGNTRWSITTPFVWDGGGADGTCGGGAGDGNKWSCAANWDQDAVPGSTDAVVFNATSTKNCKLDASVTVDVITMGSGYTGTFDFQSYTLTVTGNADFRTGGAFTPGTGKVAFTGASAQILRPPGQTANTTLPTLEQDGAGGTTVTTNRLRTSSLILTSGSFNLGSGLTDTVTSSLTSAGGTLDFGSSTLVLEATTADFSGLTTLTPGSGTLSFNATSGTQAFTPKSGATFPPITKANAGTVTVATNGLTSGGALTVTGGTWNWGSSTLTHAVTAFSFSNSPTLTFGSNTVQVTSGNADMSGLGTLNANSGTLAFTAASGTQVLTPKSAIGHPHISHAGAGTLQLATNDLSTLSFSQSAGTLDFNGRNITTTSAGNFTVSNGSSASFSNLGGRTLTVAGNAAFSGITSSYANLNPGSTWTINATGTLTASYALIGNSNASGSSAAGQANSCENMGSNTNWNFLLNTYAAWNQSATIAFNTTSTGANVSGNVANFPLLVRLDSNNFNFNQAQPDGKDIRFADPDGTSLSYAIERWSFTQKKAELWVKVPQVDGNSALDYIKMYWGNSSATSLANSAAVFAGSDNFRGVWHLAEDGNTSAGGYADASSNGLSGTGSGMTSSSDVDGMAGRGQTFDGTATRITMGTNATLGNVTSSFTVSLWMKATGTPGGRMWASSRNLTSNGFGLGISGGQEIQGTTFGVKDYITAGSTLSQGQWYHLTMVVDAGFDATFYLNGAFRETVAHTVAGNANTDDGFLIGANQSVGGAYNEFFKGILDEVRVESAIRNADWVKLCYETQKLNTTAVTYPNTALSTFAYSAKVYLNTTPTGAGTTSDVTNFPMLVRLTAANFNFAQAKADGGDIRFADSAGNLLSYDMERFDAAAKAAEFWVRIPTVKGNNNSQWFRMYWGKGTATSIADKYGVWSVFEAAWHLAESPGGTAPQFEDRSLKGNDGTAQAGATGDSVTAVVGKGFALNGSSKYVSSTRSYANPSVFTIGTWFKTSTSTGGWILGFGQAQTGLSTSHDRFIWMDNTGKLSIAVNPGGVGHTVTSTLAYNDGAWHHAMAKVSGTGLAFYVDGILVGSDATATGGENFTGYWRAGYDKADWSPDPTSDYLNGSLDEVWVTHTELSADFIKLAHATQKAGSTVAQVGARSLDYSNSVRLNFNTTATGANVAGNVANIPILVRLTSATIDFTKTNSAGSDLQFVDKSGAYLYHEVVDWDKGNRTGTVWVKVPQVDGNSLTDYITLYYGCSTCTGTPFALSDSVWSAYSGAWHLNISKENQAKDAASKKNHLNFTQDVPYAAGITAPLSPYFNSSDARIADPASGDLDLGTGNFTFMAWIKTTQAAQASVWPVLAGKMNPAATPRYGYGMVMDQAGANGGKFAFELWSNGAQKQTPFSSSVVNDGNWHFLVGKRSGTTLESYVDGVSQGTTAASGVDPSDGVDFAIGWGADQNANNLFQGYINDVSLAKSAFSADYIKLSYMNQKATDALLSTPITLSTSSFQSSKVFKFNTTASGANVAGDVYDFPLLLRFTDATLIDATQGAGQDIRFLDADGVTWLDYQIERWDQTNNVGEIWVKVPKVDGNSTGDFITMYYNDAAGLTLPDGQCGTCVFSTANGFSGVWHLNESVSDATANGYNGTDNSTADAAGIIGRGRSFNGTSSHVSCGTTAGSATSLTASFWMNPNTASGYRRGMGKNASSGTQGWDFLVRPSGESQAIHFRIGTEGTYGGWPDPLMQTNMYVTSQWDYMVGTYDFATSTGKFYRNGVQVDSYTNTDGRGVANTGATLYLGRYNTEYFSGSMDEARVATLARSADWIKLEYESQRSSPTLFNPSAADFVSSRKYAFNTTRTGANIMGDVDNFPLLVRITGSTIVDAVQNDYDDIRFLDGDGKSWLNYHVERWSKTADTAEVWVLVPRVDGNSDNDFITLYYDDATNGAVANGECASCIFSATNGYSAVWHLNDNAANATVDEVMGAANDGTFKSGASNENTSGHSTGGIIHTALDFQGGAAGVGGGTQLNSFTHAQALSKSTGSISMWVKPDQLRSMAAYYESDGTSASFNGYGVQDVDAVEVTMGTFLSGTTAWNFTYQDGDDAVAYASVDAGAPTTGWAHVVTTWNRSGSSRMYVNGALIGSSTLSSLTWQSRTATVKQVGRVGDGTDARHWDGKLDEIQLSTVERSADWVKLAYQTQRSLGENTFWNSRPGPNNKAVLTATANTQSISLSWPSSVTDSANADSVGIWVKYTGAPDSVGASGQTKVVVLPKADSAYTYPASYPNTYYFALAVRNSSGQWSPFTSASTDTAILSLAYSFPDTIYVDSAIGNDANSCTAARNPATPRQTIEAADGCDSNAGDTLVIRVMPGTYSGTGNDEFDSNNKPVVVTSFDNNSRAILNSSGSGVRNGATRYWTVFLWGGVTLRNVNVMCAANTYSGVYLTGATGESGQAVEGCRIYNNGSLIHDKGIEINGTIGLKHIAGNIIHQPATYGIANAADNGYNIVGNVLVGNGGANTKAIDVTTAAFAADATIANNIVYNWDYGIATASYTAATGVVSNNLFHLVTSGRELTTATDDAKVIKDPLFYTADISDRHAFKLLPGSPAIDAGTSSYGSGAEACGTRYPLDYFGASRPQGGATDIGAYEGSGYTPNPTASFDTLTNTVSGNTVIVKNTRWKLVWDMARGGGITGFYDMTGDTTANLVGAGSLLFDTRIDSHLASEKTGNTIAPVFWERTRTRSVVRQRLALSASLDLSVWYTVYASGHVYVQGEIANLTSGTVDVDVVQYSLKVGSATAATLSASNLAGISYKNGYGFLATATKDALLAVAEDLDGNGYFAETWSQAGSTAGSLDSAGFRTDDLADPAAYMKRHHHFLLYVGDNSLDAGKAAALNADAYNPSAVTASAGSLLHERSWQDQLGGHWPLDDGAGSVARDKSINYANNGALTSATWVSGKVNGALRLTTSSVVTVADADPLEAGQHRAVMAWVKPDFSAMGADAFVLSKGLTTASGWHFRRVSGASRIKFVVGSAEVQSPVLASGEWVHLAGSMDGARMVTLYVNGVLAGAAGSTTTYTTNSDALLMGKDGGGADAFAGDLDDVRVYHDFPGIGQLQSIVNRGFSARHGNYHLRADNNNRLVALLNETTAQTRIQPAFRIDNWYAAKTPKYVYLNGTRLVPNSDYVVDSIIHNGEGVFGNSLVLQVNKVLTGTNQVLFVDDNDSSGYMGEAAKMKGLTMSATANDKFVIKNFSDSVFGSATSGQWYLELDLNGWTTPTAEPATDGFGEFNVWKAAAINPNLAVTGATNQVGLYKWGGRTLSLFWMDNTGNNMFSSGRGYAGPANIAYTLVDSSATRVSMTLSTMTFTAAGNITMVKRWTVYPTGRIIGSYQFATSDHNMPNPSLFFQGRYSNNQVYPTWSDATGTSTARMGLYRGELDFHSLVGGALSIKSGGSTVSTAAAMMDHGDDHYSNAANNDYSEAALYFQTGLFQSTDDPVTVNFAMDISRDFDDPNTADSLMKDLQTPAAITAVAGTAVTDDALDFNADGFAEGDGAYTYTASGSGVAHFRFVNTVTHFSPAFRIKSWTFATLPEFVAVDNQTLTLGYHYNAYVNTATNELLLQLNRTLSPATHAFYISHKTGLAVSLNRFEAVGGDGVDTLKWTTESEFENLGFHVWRRLAPGLEGVDTALAAGAPDAGAGIANALRDELRTRAAAKLAAGAADTVPRLDLSPEELKSLGWVRINARLIPGARGGSSATTSEYLWVDRTAAYGTAYEYLLEAVDFSGSRSQYGPRLARPKNPLETALEPNYPNPFNPVTTLRFTLKEKARVTLAIYDSRGRLVRTLIRPGKPMAAGRYRLIWDARDDKGFEVPSGQYFYRFTAPKYAKTRKMILVK